MRLINHTSWKNEELSKFFKAGLTAKGADHTDYIVCASPSRSRKGSDHEETRAEGWIGEDGKAIHGYAYRSPMIYVRIEGKKVQCHCKRFIRMFLPEGQFDLKKFAQVFEHEIDHTLGLRHRDMLKSKNLDPVWHEGFTLSQSA